jgi:hypothetical protein
MNMVPYEAKELNYKPRMERGAIYALLDRFLDSDHQCVKVTGWNHVSANVCKSSIDTVIKRERLFGVKVTVRGNEVFLVKKDYKNT